MRNSFSGLGGERRREREFEFLLMLFEEIDVLTASFIVKKMQFRGNTRFKREGERMKHCGNKTFHFVHLMNPGSIFAPLALFWPPQHFLIEMKKKSSGRVSTPQHLKHLWCQIWATSSPQQWPHVSRERTEWRRSGPSKCHDSGVWFWAGSPGSSGIFGWKQRQQLETKS